MYHTLICLLSPEIGGADVLKTLAHIKEQVLHGRDGVDMVFCAAGSEFVLLPPEAELSPMLKRRFLEQIIGALPLLRTHGILMCRIGCV